MSDHFQLRELAPKSLGIPVGRAAVVKPTGPASVDQDLRYRRSNVHGIVGYTGIGCNDNLKKENKIYVPSSEETAVYRNDRERPCENGNLGNGLLQKSRQGEEDPLTTNESATEPANTIGYTECCQNAAC
ncbi:hypothetical protein WAI453_012056 [Rhynchosporium graminicola]